MKKKKNPNQKAFQIVTKKEPATPPVQTSEELATNIGSEKNVSFAMSIALQMKQQQREADETKKVATKKRPIGRNKKYSPADLQAFERKLVELRESILSHSSSMKSSIGIEEADDFEPDGGDGTSQSMRLDTLSRIDNSQRTLSEIDEALRKIGDGTYGVCISCGQLVSRERLIRSPFVKTCTACQQELEANR